MLYFVLSLLFFRQWFRSPNWSCQDLFVFLEMYVNITSQSIVKLLVNV